MKSIWMNTNLFDNELQILFSQILFFGLVLYYLRFVINNNFWNEEIEVL